MEYENVNINYTLYGNNNKGVIVLLHGWGQNIDMMRPIGDNYTKDYQVLIIDLPGFGLSSEPKYPWHLDNYVEAVRKVIEKEGISNPIMMGHSFGGKIAIMYASKYDVKKLVLFASPINHNQKISLKSKVLKRLKKLPLMDTIGEKMKKHIGSTDYKSASSVMREILVNHINEDIYHLLGNIKASTLIIWGESDTVVDPAVAEEISKGIKDSGVVMLPGTHYAYLENLGHVINILDSFMEG